MLSANQITCLRFFFTFPFLYLMLSTWGLVNKYFVAILFIFLALTDYLDGAVARRKNQITQRGKFLDPLADKILVCGALIGLLWLNRFSFWPVVLIIFREITVSSVRGLSLTYAAEIAEARILGKIKTVLQLLAIFLGIIQFSQAEIVLWFAVVLSIISGIDYVGKVLERVKGS